MGSKFLRHEPCPECGSKDNLGIWEDGQYCFGCGWSQKHRSLSKKDLRQQLKEEENQKNKNGKYANLTLPSDFTRILPQKPWQWLEKYGLTQAEIYRNKFGWSENDHSLVMPVYDVYGNLLLYQSRVFADSERTSSKRIPKYLTRGNNDAVYHVLGANSPDIPAVVCVEDYVSAIKVSRNFPAMPLFGSTLSINRIRTLSDLTSTLIIWLDHDKRASAVKIRFRANPYFKHVGVVVSKLDPKEYTDAEIASLVCGSL